jgi:hypothetical protein
MGIFEHASRLKLRFKSPQGSLTAEDLWDLPLTSKVDGKANLDTMAVHLHLKLRNSTDVVSFVEEDATAQDTVDKLKFSILRHVIDVKKDDNQTKLKARENKERKQILLGILAKKENEALEGLSAEQIQDMIEKL